VLGPCGKVGVLKHGQRDTYSYSNDRYLGFAPIRLAESPDGDITLFANWQGNPQLSQVKGILLYHSGKFTPDPTANPESFRAAEKQKEADGRPTTAGRGRRTGWSVSCAGWSPGWTPSS
jgi:hypothetical protein